MSRCSAVTAALGVVVAGVFATFAADDGAREGWPQFRGPNRDGISAESGLLKSWPEKLNEIWRRELGEGYSGISAVGSRLFTMFASGGDTFAVSLDADTGKELWRTRLDDKFRDNWGNGPRSTPTVDGKRVYVLSAKGKLFALGIEDGATVWSRDLRSDYGAQPPQWGVSTSPLVEDDKLLVDVGGRGKGASIVAFDKVTGKEIWRSQNDKPGYSAPVAVTVNGKRQIVFLTGTRVVSVDPADGTALWDVPWETSYDVNASAPIFVAPDKIFISTGYDVGAALFRITGGKVGEIGVEQVWKSRAMRNKFSSSIYLEGHIYGFDEKTLKCLDARTGEVRWQQRGLGHGSLFFADGSLFVLSDEGTLILVEASPSGYVEKGRTRVFDGRTWTVPTLSGGRLFMRDAKQIVALVVSD